MQCIVSQIRCRFVE